MPTAIVRMVVRFGFETEREYAEKLLALLDRTQGGGDDGATVDSHSVTRRRNQVEVTETVTD